MAIERPQFDPAAALRHLDGHRKAFGVPDSAPLDRFVDLVGEAKSCTIECSCKMEAGRVHAARFNLWFQEAPAPHQLDAARRFLRRVEESEGVALDDGLLRRFSGTDLDWSRTDAFVVGIDLRERKPDSRLKVWFKLGAYPAKEEEAFRLAPSGDGVADLRRLLVRPGLLVGFDFHLDGRAAVKLYTRIEKADLLDRATRTRLAAVLSREALERMDASAWSYVSLARDDGARVLHFRPFRPASFIASLVGPQAVAILERQGREGLLETVVSVRERDLVAPSIADYNLYLMVGSKRRRHGAPLEEVRRRD